LAAVEGALSNDERAAVEEHVGGCAACSKLLAESALTGDAEEHAAQVAADDRIGRYQVLGPLGAGGMGIVYKARDPDLDRPLAIKLWRPALDAQPLARARVLEEARAMARLHHPNVVAVYDVGTWREQVFIAMELVEGIDVRAWLDRQPRSWRETL